MSLKNYSIDTHPLTGRIHLSRRNRNRKNVIVEQRDVTRETTDAVLESLHTRSVEKGNISVTVKRNNRPVFRFTFESFETKPKMKKKRVKRSSRA